MTRDQDYQGFLLEQARALQDGDLSHFCAPDVLQFLLEAAGSNEREVERRLSDVITYMTIWDGLPNKRTELQRLIVIHSLSELEIIFSHSKTLQIYAEKNFAEVLRRAHKYAEFLEGITLPQLLLSFQQYTSWDFVANFISIEGLQANPYYKENM